MKSVETNVIENLEIAKNFYRLRFFWDRTWGTPLAGNFCEIKVNNLSVPLLRRPFAFSDYNEKEKYAEIIYQKRGTATDVLSRKKSIESNVKPIENEDEDARFFISFEDDFSMEKIHILAPLGNSFYYTSDISSKQRVFAVAGGVGLGPILFAVKTSPFPALLVAGYRNETLVPKADIFQELKIKICTDDGSEGFKGTVVEYLRTSDINSNDLIVACGPLPMLKALHGFAVTRNIMCKVSMEEMMACGVGACMGCVVPCKNGKYRRVCKEGAIFDSREIVWG
ncbi:MAG: dihydroorotate dehydrogenase electron transfer subunit [Chitinivibrionia bacterium]|nr:dihydroorotate dehydrogenase electron transfer subunit [Chitinivibrionia bacterium]